MELRRIFDLIMNAIDLMSSTPAPWFETPEMAAKAKAKADFEAWQASVKPAEPKPAAAESTSSPSRGVEAMLPGLHPTIEAAKATQSEQEKQQQLEAVRSVIAKEERAEREREEQSEACGLCGIPCLAGGGGKSGGKSGGNSDTLSAPPMAQ